MIAAAFDALYAPEPGMPRKPAMLATPTSVPCRAARKIARAIGARKRFYVLPWQMAIAGRVLRMLPRPVYDRIFAKAPVKPRRPD